jgi:protocatechuate 3,4-dioxygenase beta subunit
MHHGEPVAPAALTVVVSDDRGPIADAAVRLVPDDGDAVVVATGRDGAARADQLAPGRWRISASAAGHVPAALPPHDLAPGADDRVAIALATGGRPLTGTVSDASGGPIAGARIDAARLSGRGDTGDAVATALTGPDGKYRMTVAEGRLMVAASSPDYASQAHPVEVGAAGAVADFALVPGGAIEGIVRDAASHEPVAGASVAARRSGGGIALAEPGSRRATAGPDGRFRLGGLRPGSWSLSATDHARFTRQPTMVGLGVAEQAAGVELLVGPGAVVRGRVVDDTGAAAPGAVVRSGGRDPGTAHAGADGGFILEGLPPGNYQLVAGSDRYVAAGVTRIALADHDLDGVIVRVARSLTVTGHVEPRQVCDVQQEAVESMDLALRAPAVTTGPDGAFALGPIAEGAIRIAARCPSGDQGTAQARAAAGAPDIVVPLTAGGSVAGRVIDPSGAPIAGTGVVATEVSHGERTTIRNGVVTSGIQTVSDAAGAYHITGLSAGSYRLSALDRGRPLALRTAPPTVELAAAEHKTGVDITAERADGVIAGTVTDPDGKPLADAWVSVQLDLFNSLGGGPGGARSGLRAIAISDDGDTDPIAPALTDARGHYTIGGLAPASYTVIAEAQRGQLRARASAIRPTATVDLRLAGLTQLSGTVTGPGGPTALFTVELDGPTRSQRSFTAGAFSFDRIDPGSYTVRVSCADGNGQARVDVTAGTPATVAITLAANAIVVGTLVDSAGKPLANQPLALITDHGDGHLQLQLDGPPTTTGPDGRFRLEHRPEPTTLVVIRPRPFSKSGLVLTAGQTLDLGTITVTDAPSLPPPGPGPGSAPPPAPPRV